MNTGPYPEPDFGEDDTRETETGEPTPATLTGPGGSSLVTRPSEDSSADARVPLNLGEASCGGSGPPVHSLLIIEDDPWDARLLEAMLQGFLSMPVAFTHAGTLEQGLKEIQDRRIQLVLTDLKLPDSSASETIPRLCEGAPGIPVIVLSGYADDQIREDALAAGAHTYLVKGDVNNHVILTEIITQLEALPDLDHDSR